MFHFLAAEVLGGPQPKALSRTVVGSKCAVGKAELVRGWLWPPGPAVSLSQTPQSQQGEPDLHRGLRFSFLVGNQLPAGRDVAGNMITMSLIMLRH